MSATHKYSDINLWVGRFSNNELVYDYDAINQNIFLIVTTPIRSKWFDIFLGSNIYKYLFEPMDDETTNAIRTEISTLMSRNREPRAKVTGISVVANYDMEAYGVEVSYVCEELSDKPHTFRFSLNRQGN